MKPIPRNSVFGLVSYGAVPCGSEEIINNYFRAEACGPEPHLVVAHTSHKELLFKQ